MKWVLGLLTRLQAFRAREVVDFSGDEDEGIVGFYLKDSHGPVHTLESFDTNFYFILAPVGRACYWHVNNALGDSRE
jgi:hypothetical protein